MATLSLSYLFVDGSNAPLEAPRVWIGGQEIALTSSGTAVYRAETDASGKPVKKNVWGWVQADGFKKKSFAVVAADGSYATRNTIQVDPEPASSGDVELTVSPQEISGVAVALTGTAAFSDTIQNGRATLTDLPSGQYHLVATKEGYTSPPVDFEVPLVNRVEIEMTAVDAGGEQAQPDADPSVHFSATASADDFDAAVAAATPPRMTADTYEQIYGNSAFEGYYTSSQARVYIGNLFIDEMQSIQFAGQANVVPVYGYASRIADAFADGKSLVQGQLVLNYVNPAYMFTVLDEYQRNLSSSDLTAAVKDGQDLAKLLAGRRALAATGQLPSSLDDRIAALASTPEAIPAAKKKLRSQGFDPVYLNPIYLRILFDLTIEIGAEKETATFRRLEKCRITSNEQIFDESGAVIGDAFGFIARRVR